MYINKFSTGTILALLALSGMLFLVPIAAPVHAGPNASLPGLKTTPTLVLQETPTALTEAVTNPASNAYAIQTVTLIAPSGWNFTTAANVALTLANLNVWCANAGYGFTSVAVSLTAIECGTGSLPPGFTATFATNGISIQGPASPAAAAPVTGSFTTSVSDASGAGAYPGPTWTETSIAAHAGVYAAAHNNQVAPGIAVTGNVAGYTAGASPQTVTATLTVPSQAGVPITFGVGGGYPAATFTTTFTPSSGSTSATGVVTSSWQPSNHAGDNTAPTATITGSSIAAGVSGQVTTTAAGAPTTVAFTLAAATFPATDYVTANVVIGPTTYANIPGPGTIAYTAADSFGNSAGGAVTSGTLSAANGFFLATPATTTCTIITLGNTCTGAVGTVPQYSQGGAYGTIGQISGTLNGVGFSVSGTTGFIQTSTFANNAGFTWPTVASPQPVTSNVDYKVQLNVVQSGVPVKIQLCVHSACAATSKNYAGTFSNGVSVITGVTNSSGSFGSVFTLSKVLGAAAVLNASITQPQNGALPQSFYGVVSETIATSPGVAAAFQVYAVFGNGQGAGFSGPNVKNAIASSTLYVDAVLTDAYGNVVSNVSPQQVQVNLAASGVSGGGLLGVTLTFISSGSSSTNNTAQGSFGPVAWTLPATLGASTVTATGVVAGNAVTGAVTVTTISPLPTINVKAPAPVSGVIYSSSPFVTFSGKANASLGYPAPFVGEMAGPPGYPTPVNVVSVGYKVNSGHWISSSVAAGNKIVWSVPVTLGTGLSTIAFNATDSKGNVGIPTTATYQVLVDSVAPTITFAGTTSNTGCEVVTAATAAGDFNEATSGTGAFTATFGGVAVPGSAISFAGTQTLGTAGSVTATICGLTSQTATLSVTGSTLAGLSTTVSESLTVTVPFADSVTFTTGSATWGNSGAASGIFVPVTNSWNTAQQLTIYATLKSGSSTYVLVGGETLAAGQTGTVFVQDFLVNVPVGTYTVTFSAQTTAHNAVSAPTTAISVTT